MTSSYRSEFHEKLVIPLQNVAVLRELGLLSTFENGFLKQLLQTLAANFFEKSVGNLGKRVAGTLL